MRALSNVGNSQGSRIQGRGRTLVSKYRNTTCSPSWTILALFTFLNHAPRYHLYPEVCVKTTMDKSIPRTRENLGHSAEVLPDLMPYEVDMLTKNVKVCDSFDVRRKGGLTCSSSHEWARGPQGIFTPTKPSVLFYDGRAYNQLAEFLFLLDPCKYKRNIYPFVPQRPISFVPAPGHYSGLGKPPVRQYFKLTPMRVHEDRIMPSYEILDRQNICHYYQDAV